MKWVRANGNCISVVQILAPFWCLPILMSLCVFPAASAVVTDLGSLGGPWARALAINDLGEAAGSAALPGNGTVYHAFVYTGSQMKDLGTLGGSRSVATGINIYGDVVGWSLLPGDEVTHAFLYTAGKMVDLGTLGAPGSYAWGINNSRQIVGNSAVGPEKVISEYIAGGAFLWSNGEMINLGTAGGFLSFAYGINNAGQVVGSVAGAKQGDGLRAFIYAAGTMVELGTLGPSFYSSRANAINSRGDVVGSSQSLDARDEHAFLYSHGVMRDLGTLDGGRISKALGINDRGEIVGSSLTTPFLYKDGVMRNLNSLLAPGSGWQFIDANCINSNGLIGGGGNRSGLGGRAYIFDPNTFSSATYTIAGRVTLTGSPLGNVTIRLTGTKTAMILTGADGKYLTPDLDVNGTYTLTPSMPGFAFTPSSRTSTAPLSLQNGDFVASRATVPPPSISPGGIGPIFSSATSIQPGSWVSIYGSNLSGGIATWNNDFPNSLGGTTVTINGKPCSLWYVSPGQINLQAPDDTATGIVSVVVTTESGTFTSTVTLAPASPSFSLLDDKHVAGIILRNNGTGAYGGGTYDIVGPTGNSLGYRTVAAKAGDSVVLFGVGFGQTNPAVAAGKPYSGAAETVNPVQLRINNVIVAPTFSGLTSAGLYQFNLVNLPGGLGTGDVTLQASVLGIQTPSIAFSLQ